MFERFTQAARATVVQAQNEARHLHHPQIGPEHLLLAVLAGDTGGARVLLALGTDPEAVRTQVPAGPRLDSDALLALGIDLDEVRSKVEDTFGVGALERPWRREGWWRRRVRHIPFTAGAKLALEQSLREALGLGHRHIGSEHLVLGLLADEGGTVRQILAATGVRPPQDEVRSAVRRAVAAA